MSLNKILVLNFFTLFFIFCLSLQPCFSAEDWLNITISDFESTLEVLQGKCKAAPFLITNRYSETVYIIFRIDKPADMDVTSFPKFLATLNSGQTVAGNLNVCVNEYLENNTYNISFWIDTTTKVNESRVRSGEYILGVTVLNNPEITTTSTISETTTSQVTSTSTIYTPVTTTTMESFDISIDKPRIGNLPGGEKLATVVVIAIALILIMIPYITFIKDRKAKTGSS